MSAARMFLKKPKRPKPLTMGRYLAAQRKAGNHTPVATFWNGEPCEAVCVSVVMGVCPNPHWWCRGLDGTTRAAVRITYQGEKFYIDNETGQGWLKVTVGSGLPRYGHASISQTEGFREL